MSPLVSQPSLRANATTDREPKVLVACPDARPPAYEAAAGLAAAGLLDVFVTGYFHDPNGLFDRLAGPRGRRVLQRRTHQAIPAARVVRVPSFDAALAIERRLGADSSDLRGGLARWRTERFDATLARTIERRRPDVALLFSDVASELAGPTCRRLGIPTILSIVHGDVREEARILEREERRCPEAFSLYLGETPIDRRELAWLHERRLRDLDWADLILVPSEHIAGELRRNSIEPERIRVVPYAAEIDRFRPDPAKRRGQGCTFLFAGGIAQRKGVYDLLRAWHRVRRPGWRLQLLGGVPRDLSALEPWLDGVELIGRVPHSEVPARMAAADAFVFPSLFEGSAVVTYEALACGLPCIVTPAAGSVVRDGVEGLVVAAADVTDLASAIERIGLDAALRAEMGRAARRRAEEFAWPRYHAAIAEAVNHAFRTSQTAQGEAA